MLRRRKLDELEKTSNQFFLLSLNCLRYKRRKVSVCDDVLEKRKFM